MPLKDEQLGNLQIRGIAPARNLNELLAYDSARVSAIRILDARLNNISLTVKHSIAEAERKSNKPKSEQNNVGSGGGNEYDIVSSDNSVWISSYTENSRRVFDLSTILGANGGGAYNGYFKVTKSGNMTVNVSRGVIVTHEQDAIAVEKKDNLAVTASGYVLLIVQRQESASGITWTGSFSFALAEGGSTAGVLVIPIAYVAVANGVISKITQLYHSAPVLSDTYKVMTSGTDTYAPGFLEDKIVAADSSVTITTSGGKIQIKSNGGGSSGITSIAIDSSLADVLSCAVSNSVATISLVKPDGEKALIYNAENQKLEWVDTVDIGTLID